MRDFNPHPLLGERARLKILATLATLDHPIDFSSLLESTELTKGNLSVHIRKLEEAGLVKVSKQFVDRKPCTTYVCTAKGKRQLKEYLLSIEELIKGLS